MVTEETRRQFGAEYAASHRRYQEERDKQFDIYKITCTREQTVRDRNLRLYGERDPASVQLIHADYDVAVGRAGHIYERYEARAWGAHMARSAELRAKYGIMEVAE